MQNNSEMFDAAVQALITNIGYFFSTNEEFNQLRENLLGQFPSVEDELADRTYFANLNNLITKALARVIDQQYHVDVSPVAIEERED